MLMALVPLGPSMKDLRLFFHPPTPLTWELAKGQTNAKNLSYKRSEAVEHLKLVPDLFSTKQARIAWGCSNPTLYKRLHKMAGWGFIEKRGYAYWRKTNADKA